MVETRYFSCNLCEALCGLEVTVDGERVAGIRGDADDVFSRGHVCPKAIGLGELLHDPDRLRQPMRRLASGGFEPVSWDAALDEAASRLRAIRERHGRDAVALYVGNPVVHSLRSGLAAQLLTNALRTRNRFDPNSQDSNPRLFACMQVYGDALAMPVPDVDHTRHLLVLGGNPAVSQGSQMGLGDVRRRLTDIRTRGGRVILVDPRRTESARLADRHCFIRPGGDAALLLAMLHVLFRERRVDARAVDAMATGRRELARIAERFPPERVAAAIGIDADTITALARELSDAPSACVYARVGVCQSEFGPLACWLVEALNIVTGNLDRVGGAMFSAPAADIAPLGRRLVGNHHGRWRSRVRGLPELLGALPSAVMAEEMETPGDGQIRGLVCLAGNPVLTTPNGPRLERAIEGLEHVVAIDYYLNETTRHAHIVLPPRHVFETGNYDVILARLTVRNVARYSPPILETSDDTRDDWSIACELAARVLGAGRLAGPITRAARSAPERLIDALLRMGPHDVTLDSLRDAPHGVDLGPLRPSGGAGIHHPDGRARLAPEALVADVPRLERWIDAVDDVGLVLIGRRHLRDNNSWMHNLPALAKGPSRAALFMHPTDAAARGLTDGAAVRIESRTGSVDATLRVTDEMRPGVVSLPHGFGHADARDTLRVAGALAGPNANALTDEARVEPVLGTSILNGVPVEVRAGGFLR
ncbi:MAG: molybdopterin-dependent oxidoreductase [Sandaracinaceae bacterium]|nr:molybdopterin-dependent oxidoreductase [Sandaracinaceae bacterium]